MKETKSKNHVCDTHDNQQQRNVIKVKERGETTRGYVVVERMVQRTDHIVDEQILPLFDLDAIAGFLSQEVEDDEPGSLILFPGIPECHGTMHVRGDSMYPKLENGDIIAYKFVQSRRAGLCFGEMYIIAYQDEYNDVHLVVKYLKEADDPSCYCLVSENEDYAPRIIPRDSVMRMAIVKASARYFVTGAN